MTPLPLPCKETWDTIKSASERVARRADIERVGLGTGDILGVWRGTSRVGEGEPGEKAKGRDVDRTIRGSKGLASALRLPGESPDEAIMGLFPDCTVKRAHAICLLGTEEMPETSMMRHHRK